MSISIIPKETQVKEVYIVNHHHWGRMEFTSPLSAAKAYLLEWLREGDRGKSNVDSLASYLLHEGTDELVAKVEELREWLRLEEGQES